jgi:hypothetical protein
MANPERRVTNYAINQYGKKQDQSEEAIGCSSAH